MNPSPINMEAEQGLLGALLVQPAAYRRVAGFLRCEHFGNAVHARVYNAIGRLLEAEKPVDPVLVRETLGEDPVLVPHGGTARYLGNLITSAVTAVNAEHYGRAIVNAAHRRSLIDIANGLIAAACQPEVPIADLIGHSMANLPGLATDVEPALAMTCGSDLADCTPPERPWIVRDWLPSRQVTFLTGEGGGGKSQLGLQLQASASVGCPWIGLDVEGCRSVGFYAEDEQEELHRRFRGIVDANDAPASAYCNMHWRSVVADQAELIELDEGGGLRTTAYYRQIERVTLDFGARLLILDAVTNLFGGDEIKRRQVNAFIGILRRLAIKMNGAVLLLGHPSAAGIQTGSGISGSTHWHNAVRSRLYLARATGEDADPDERTLTRVKANYAGAGDVLRLRWDRGTFVAIDPPGSLDRVALAAKADRVFLALLAATYTTGTWCSASPTARNYAPTLFTRHFDCEGLPKLQIEGAMHRLLRSGRIASEAYGPPSKAATRLTIV